MVDSIQPNLRNPTIRYRLDPGEPGVANPAKATSSVYTVVGQESRNRARLKAEALREGRQVLLVKTDYKVRREGSFSVVVGGLTTVVSRDRPERAVPLEEATAGEVNGVVEAAPEETSEESQEQIDELRAEERQLEEEIRRLEREERRGSPYAAAQAEQRIAQAENRLREIEEALRPLRARAAGGPGAAGGEGGRVGQAVRGLDAALGAVGQLVDFLV